MMKVNHKKGVTMALMNSDVYDAFILAKVPEASARKAAESVAAYESRFTAIERDLHLLKWMHGTTLVMVSGILVRLFTLH